MLPGDGMDSGAWERRGGSQDASVAAESLPHVPLPPLH